jgi:hypothetical protein
MIMHRSRPTEILHAAARPAAHQLFALRDIIDRPRHGCYVSVDAFTMKFKKMASFFSAGKVAAQSRIYSSTALTRLERPYTPEEVLQ